MITTKINGVQGLTINQTEAKVKDVSIGEVVTAMETIINASKVMGAQTFARIMTDKLYSSHEESFIKMLELAGERAKSIQQDQYMEANKDSIVSCGMELSRR